MSQDASDSQLRFLHHAAITVNHTEAGHDLSGGKIQAVISRSPTGVSRHSKHVVEVRRRLIPVLHFSVLMMEH